MDFLTQEQQAKLDAHILKCVYKNVTLNYTGKIGQPNASTVQELLTLNVSTLEKIGKSLEALSKQHGGSRFNKGSRLQLPAGSGVYADDWMDAIELIIIKKDAEDTARKNKAELDEINEQLNNLKTPQEQRQELEDRRRQLTGESVKTVDAGASV